jgi:carbamoyl-phosphate synthase large subunit
VGTAEQARAWITLWRDLQQVSVSDFTLSEYLPGRHLVVQTLWRDGELVLAQSIEVLSHFAAGNNPSGVFSLPSLAKTIVAPALLDTALRALRAIDQRPAGALLVEFREAANGRPCVTEVTAGRFPSGLSALVAAGKPNMIALFAACALGEPVTVDEPRGASSDTYLVRDIDTIPGVFSAGDLMEGVERAP